MAIFPKKKSENYTYGGWHGEGSDHQNRDSDQKSIFYHNRLIGVQK